MLSLRPILREVNPPTLCSSTSRTTYICIPSRNARLLKRPKRPYTFSQLVTLSDGSAFMMRTTSPLPVYRSTRDTRNSILWNPSSKDIANAEEDEAGRLAGFRARYGRGFDTKKEAADVDVASGEGDAISAAEEAEQQRIAEEEDANILDLISNFGQQRQAKSSLKDNKK